MSDERDARALASMARQARVKQLSADMARLEIEEELASWHGRVPVREIARETGLSAATISNVFRGRLTVSLDNVERIAACLVRRGLS